jgi:WD40 repeat protein
MSATPLIETTNTLERPSGPEFQLVLGEGSYTLKDDLHLVTPAPHPSEAPLVNSNPLATNVGLPTATLKLSVTVLAPRKPPTNKLFRIATSGSLRSSIPPSIEEETQSSKSDAGSLANGFGTASYYNHTPSFGDENPLLAVGALTKTKKDQKPKPKTNIVKSSSTFVSRVVPHESLQKRLNERSHEGMFAFSNIGRAFLWLDLSSETKADQLNKILFTKAHPSCHDINSLTKSSNHIDVVIGFNTGDIIWYEPFSQKYTRLNKNGVINSAVIASVLWLPGKDHLFLVAHRDGTIFIYDKEKEDAEFVAEESSAEDDAADKASDVPQTSFHVKKSVNSRNQKSNPVAAWKVSTMSINDVAFSPDGQLLAVVSEDGTLTILDYMHERVLDVYRSYYGAMLCVTWSPDGQYVLTGGQDDLVSIWSIADQALVARCVGHQSWVTDVKFDPWRCDERNYRFGSVGEDCRLLLWDFSVGMLGRPKAMRQRGSVSSHHADRRTSVSTVSRIGSATNLATAERSGAAEIIHEVNSKASTANLPPVMSKQIGEEPMSWLGFEEHCILTACKDGKRSINILWINLQHAICERDQACADC